MDTILVPVDGSEPSARAAQWAANLAKRLGASITLLHVHHVPGSEALGLNALDPAQIAEIERGIANPSFDKARALMDGSVATQTLMSMGDPADEIVALARNRGFSHIVMGSRGRSPVREILLGSVSDKVVRQAHCAVTVVR